MHRRWVQETKTTKPLNKWPQHNCYIPCGEIHSTVKKSGRDSVQIEWLKTAWSSKMNILRLQFQCWRKWYSQLKLLLHLSAQGFIKGSYITLFERTRGGKGKSCAELTVAWVSVPHLGNCDQIELIYIVVHDTHRILYT